LLSEEQYEKDATVLKEAMAGWGTDEEPIIKLLTSRNNADRQQIKTFYKSSYGEDLIKAFKDELGGDFEKVVVGLFSTSLDYDCLELRRAMKGGGTDEETLIEIIGSRTTEQLTAIKDRYIEMFETELESEVADETGGDLKKLLVSLLQCNRSDTTDIDEDKLNKDLAELYEAGEGTWGTDESVFNKIFVNRSPAELRYINTEYFKACEKSLKDVVESEFSGDMKNALVTVLHALLSPVDYFATRIRAACAGLGTNDNDLIRILVSRDEIDLPEIKAVYKEKYEMSLYEQIKKECSGDYKNILLGVCRDTD